MKNTGLPIALIVSCFLLAKSSAMVTIADEIAPATRTSVERTVIDDFFALRNEDIARRREALMAVRTGWNDGDAAMLVELMRFSRNPQVRNSIFELLAESTGQPVGSDLDAWYQWIWNRNDALHPNYASFKKKLYSPIDDRFADYFDDSRAATIRLDEILWGGVKRDGIPPLKNPETLAAKDANYLADSDVVFGVEFGGQARAYPKRILAWHEMVKDVVGGRSINGVYCTLCGSMIVYDTEVSGKHYELGTSGFLYRSNKLMYDHETKSLWSTLAGTPVVGPLVRQGITLKPLHVVTTTWGEWKKRHPGTDVLSLNTGHRRNYGEGVAYAKYFATDDLMFKVPKLDERLRNKDEVLIVRIPGKTAVAITAEYLNRNPLYRCEIGERSFVVLTDDSGANRVFESDGIQFHEWENDFLLSRENAQLASGQVSRWSVTEDALVPVTNDTDMARPLPRIPAHRAFWFGWIAAFPDTMLIK